MSACIPHRTGIEKQHENVGLTGWQKPENPSRHRSALSLHEPRESHVDSDNLSLRHLRAGACGRWGHELNILASNRRLIAGSCLAQDLWILCQHIAFKIVSCWLQVPVLVGYVYARCRRYDNMVMKVSAWFIEVHTRSRRHCISLVSPPTPSQRTEHATRIDHVFAANVRNFSTPHQRNQSRRHATRSVLRRARIRGSEIFYKGHGESIFILPSRCHPRPESSSFIFDRSN